MKAKWQSHKNEIKSIALNEDETILASASIDGTIKLWNMITLKEISTLKNHNNETVY